MVWDLRFCKIINGKFTFEGKFDELTLAYLDFDNNYIMMYIEPCNLKLNIKMGQTYSYKLSGTEVGKENLELRKETELYEIVRYEKFAISYNLLDQVNLTDDISVKDSLRNIFYENSKERSAKGEKTYKAILPEYSKKSLIEKLVYRQIQQNKKQTGGLVVSIAPDFVRTDTLTNEITKFSDLRNKGYILFDFWANSCGPCIKEISALKEINNKYNKGQLRIVSISCDEYKNNWVRAIGQYKLEDWPQILSLAYSDNRLFNDDISNIYGIEYIPIFILIDRQGKIIT